MCIMGERIDLNRKVALSITEVSELLGVSRPVVHQLIHQPDFPSFRIGKRYVIPKSALEEWVSLQVKEKMDLLRSKV